MIRHMRYSKNWIIFLTFLAQAGMALRSAPLWSEEAQTGLSQIEKDVVLARPVRASPKDPPKAPPRKAKSQKKEPAYKFKSAGSKTYQEVFELDPHKTKHQGAIEEEDPGGVKLPQGLQNIVDKADNVLDHIDDATLDAVKGPFGFFGLEVDEATIRPGGNGVELGVSINIGGKKPNKGEEKDAENQAKQEDKKGGSKTLKTLLEPDNGGPGYQRSN